MDLITSFVIAWVVCVVSAYATQNVPIRVIATALGILSAGLICITGLSEARFQEILKPGSYIAELAAVTFSNYLITAIAAFALYFPFVPSAIRIYREAKAQRISKMP